MILRSELTAEGVNPKGSVLEGGPEREKRNERVQSLPMRHLAIVLKSCAVGDVIDFFSTRRYRLDWQRY